MTQSALDWTTRMRIIAEDPMLRRGGHILTAVVDVPAEDLEPGPRGYRVHVVDYDAASSSLYPALSYRVRHAPWVAWKDGPVTDAEILGDPRFHAQNVYAIVMRTLARFEYALGRRIRWGFSPGHQIKVVPHAFPEPNAFYSRRDEALLFGYFPSSSGRRHVFTCLSHGIVAHETAHALLDGLRNWFMEPSSEDQAALHEGLGDLTALLSVLGLPEVVAHLIDVKLPTGGGTRPTPRGMLQRSDVRAEALRGSILFSLGLEFGRETSGLGRSALRHSVERHPSPELYTSPQFLEPHLRGELLVAAVLNAFIDVWAARLQRYFADRSTQFMDRASAAEEGARAADYLLTMIIRAIDYCPPIHVTFPTFLSALLTADQVSNPQDPLKLREKLRDWFGRYGIEHASWSHGKPAADGTWQPLPGDHGRRPLRYDRTRFESMQHDPDEVFRFAWENRKELSLVEGAFTRVISVRPCLRVAPEDGFHVRETVAEVLQQVQLTAGELARCGIRPPDDMPRDLLVTLYGGVTLIFDEHGQVKYAIGDRVLGKKGSAAQTRQQERVASLWSRGALRPVGSQERRFAALHRLRALDSGRDPREEW